MKTVLAAVAASFAMGGVALPAAAQPAMSGPIVPAPAPCAVSVRFGSYAMGIDDRSFQRVERYVARHKRLVAASSIERWGREGERTVCISTRSRRATSQVFADIKSLIRHRAERGPTEVKTLDGRVWNANPGPPR
jgi:hypothetical protein